MSDVRLRFAPSPTGYLHVGGARTALFNWLLARKQGGTFILRIEDTDVARSTQESVDAILQGMEWLGLDWDEGPFYQSERFPVYREFVERLLAEGKAYRCYCTPEELEARREQAMKEGRKPKYDGTCRDLVTQDADRPFVVRFRAPHEGVTAFDDLIKGRIAFNNEELDDLIIQRTDGTPTYNFVVVIDDATMGITTVIRGDDHINNTPRQILLYEALGYPVPRFAHVPMILGADKTRLSKRHGATSVMAYRDMGFLPEAMVNYLVRLGWSHGDEEIFSRQDLVEKFTIEAVGKSAGVFNPDKLLWLNHHYIKESSPERLAELLVPFLRERGVDPSTGPSLPQVVKTLQERSRTLVEMADGALFYYRSEISYDEEAAAKHLVPGTLPLLASLAEKLDACADFSHSGLEAAFKEFIAEKGIKFGQLGPAVRVSLCGGTASPGIYEVVEALGKDETLRRLRRAVAYLEQ
ncbi:glutamate--tRNA ligase [Geobacter sulfurreducens]|jgi:glutamyl-tRNA synthetase|uniref:Glutamate--tRNA ligase n=1 Tax=Geobacter sulfurreducens (strain ATCC 51573 / DSM 12127 / PCA) TaxID=243231 RepID=SYE_GEOSL|nr:glutamate--tRNA ligase [Geobacter sulfurreducens]Q74DU6.1 RecName: Full=Glutamate--tRNA ligase; AltName: Full=Glutamyl-tRNA synthetase; Short=GluRS [Geobacter sulfurreducens PCA]AAR34595.1 glutamyl-tRNA synthetase, non-discriminating [Geobacter sulfurreducens PCA]ADI84054.1 glutamyl-tRNA synthetase, non-discriminating [Geobacter sulfurreducens KN400]UAC05249.1 glutamate--tRNA ligase [Geobacter sulfurreducens]HBB69157.1 glutamate--tRNA ligase [Geobacter sulfurreducens]HCD97297.1 glutamate--